MKELNVEDFKNLKHGDRVYRFMNFQCRYLDFVGFMPRNECYLIFCDGEYLTYLYISKKDNSFRGKWYSGQYDAKLVGNLLRQQYLDEIKIIEEVYLND